MTQKAAGRAFAALYPIDYGEEITKMGDLNQSWNDIKNALTNFLEMQDIVIPLRDATIPCCATTLNASFNSISNWAVLISSVSFQIKHH